MSSRKARVMATLREPVQVKAVGPMPANSRGLVQYMKEHGVALALSVAVGVAAGSGATWKLADLDDRVPGGPEAHVGASINEIEDVLASDAGIARGDGPVGASPEVNKPLKEDAQRALTRSWLDDSESPIPEPILDGPVDGLVGQSDDWLDEAEATIVQAFSEQERAMAQGLHNPFDRARAGAMDPRPDPDRDRDSVSLAP